MHRGLDRNKDRRHASVLPVSSTAKSIPQRPPVLLARACRVLLASARVEHLWTENGPTTEATALVEVDGLLSPQERVILLAALVRFRCEPLVTLRTRQSVEGRRSTTAFVSTSVGPHL